MAEVDYGGVYAVLTREGPGPWVRPPEHPHECGGCGGRAFAFKVLPWREAAYVCPRCGPVSYRLCALAASGLVGYVLVPEGHGAIVSDWCRSEDDVPVRVGYDGGGWRCPVCGPVGVSWSTAAGGWGFAKHAGTSPLWEPPWADGAWPRPAGAPVDAARSVEGPPAASTAGAPVGREAPPAYALVGYRGLAGPRVGAGAGAARLALAVRLWRWCGGVR